jgi:hypothetical protein
MGPNNQQSNFKFNVHNVMHNVSQETVYDSLARDVVQGVADGINGEKPTGWINGIDMNELSRTDHF